MVISFANLKGGVGKSKLNAVFASYLASVKNELTAFVDTDVNQKSSRSYQYVDNPFLTRIEYNYENGDLTDYILKLTESYDHVIVDLPGTFQQEGVISCLSTLDYVIIPTLTEPEDLDSTKLFLEKIEELSKSMGEQIPFKVLVNNYEVQYFGMKEIEESGFAPIKEYLETENVLEKGIRRERSMLQMNFVFGEYGSHKKAPLITPVMEEIYNLVSESISVRD